jgi:hypothetical protein
MYQSARLHQVARLTDCFTEGVTWRACSDVTNRHRSGIIGIIAAKKLARA